MTRIGRVLKGLGALVLLAVLVAGIPWALWHFVGWPLPHQLPSAAQVGRALNRQGIPAQTLIDALAVVVWLTWATLVASLAAELPAALSGRHPPHLPVVGVFQPVTGRLVAAVIVACLTLAPRPGHLTVPGSTGGSSSFVERRPVAALVVNDTMLNHTVLNKTVLTAATTTTSAPPAPAATATASSAYPSPAAATGETTYVVQRGDTLWGIAERQLGDPLRWSQIFQLNEGRPQPGGATLTDPHWIDPGWTLLLPATTTPAPTAAAPAPAPTPAAAPSATPVPTTPASTAPTTTTPATTTPTTSAPAATPATNGTAPQHARHAHDEPVRLPSGSVVAGSFAAGVLATVALGRMRRRHAYRYRPPQAGRDLSPQPSRPTLRHLARPNPADADQAAVSDLDAIRAMPFDDDERRQDPGRIEIGTRDGQPVTVEITDLSGTAICGPSSDDVARALVAGLLVRAGPLAAEVLCTAELADRLLPDLPPDRAIRRPASSDDAARTVEAERVARTRRMASVDAPDAARFRAENPENPLPLLVVLLDHLPDESLGRWAALVADAPRVGIAVLFLGDSPAATERIAADPGHTVTDTTGGLAGTRLFGLRADEAVELLTAVFASQAEADEDDDEPVTVLHPPGPAATAGQPWPEPATVTNGEDRPLVVEVLGPCRITAWGEPVSTGLRSRASILLAWFLLRPEGATSEAAVDALWPDTPPGKVQRQFWRPVGDLRTRLTSPTNQQPDVVEKVGEHYRANPAEITCDLWDFEHALTDAARADNDDIAAVALRRAVDAYRGDFLEGTDDYPWVEPVRQDLHRRAVDAHLRLAELQEHAGHPDTAVDTLERVIALDRYAEEPYRRLMALHAAHGRLDAVEGTWRLLRNRLDELDLDMEAATVRCYRALTGEPNDSEGGARRLRLSS